MRVSILTRRFAIGTSVREHTGLNVVTKLKRLSRPLSDQILERDQLSLSLSFKPMMREND